MRTTSIVAREIAATAQINGGTRVVELVARDVQAYAARQPWRVRLTAYDSNHPGDVRCIYVGHSTGEDDLDEARGRAVAALALSTEWCHCWWGWDPDCGRPGCYGYAVTAPVAVSR